MNKQETLTSIYAKNLSIKIILILSGILCLCVIPHYANYWLWKHPYCQILAELFRWHALPILAVGIIFIVSAMAFDRIGEPHGKSQDIRDYLFIFPTDNTKCIWFYIILGYGLLCWTHSLSNVLILLLLVTLLGYLVYARSFNCTSPNLQEGYMPNDDLKDVPIQTIRKDKLGRSLFINTTADIIKSLRGANNRLLLDGDWGSGKTSIINCIEHIISTEKSNIIFCRVNPWSNHTREKFIAALIGELEGFCQKTPPSFSISSKLSRNLLATLESLSIGNFTFNFPTVDSNIVNNIDHLSAKLKLKKNRLVFVIDDLDRLSKSQILDILSVVYLFSQCNNLIFILVANKSKVEEILTEQKDPCYVENNPHVAVSARQTKYYENYLDKMISNTIQIPSIYPEALRLLVLELLKPICEDLKIPPFNEDETESFPLSCFDNVRTVKRVLITFSNALHQPQLKGEVNLLHFLLVTVLYIRFPLIYDRIQNAPYYWIKQDSSEFGGDNFSNWNNYFDNLLKQYPQHEKTLEEIFYILTPNYHEFIVAAESRNTRPSQSFIFPHSLLLNPEKAFYKKRYFNKYFKQNFSENDVPDSILDELTKNYADKSSSVQIQAWALFLERYTTKLDSIFEYAETLPLPTRLKDSFVLGCGKVLEKVPSSLKPHHILHLIDLLVQFLRHHSINQKDMEKCFSRIGSTFLGYLLYEMYAKNLLNRSVFLHILQANSDLADNIFEQAKIYAQSRYAQSFIYAWMRNFNEPDESGKSYNETRTEQVLRQMENNEEDFWFLLGERIFFNMDNKTFHPELKPWGKSQIQKLTQSLLQKEHLYHRKEIASINQFFKGPESGPQAII